MQIIASRQICKKKRNMLFQRKLRERERERERKKRVVEVIGLVAGRDSVYDESESSSQVYIRMPSFDNHHQTDRLLQSGVKFTVIPETLQSPFKDHFPAYYKGLVRGEPGGFVIHPKFVNNAEKIYNMKVRSDDVWIRTFPRSGTTWTSELAWLIMNDCNFEEAARVPLTVRSPNIDTHYFTNWDDLAPSEIMNARKCRSVEKVEQMPSPRVLQSHLPFQLLPPRLLNTAKVIYVARNPKDAIVSFFYFHKLVKLCYFSGEMEQFVDYFINNQVCWTPYFFSLLDAWGKRNHPNLLILFYEDMKKDLRSQIEKMATFLDKSLTDKQVEKLFDHVRYLNCAGEMADCKTSHFTPEVSRKIDKWIGKNLEGTDLKFVTHFEE